MKFLKVLNNITAYIPLLAILSFSILFVQRVLQINHNEVIFVGSMLFIVISFFSIIIALVLFCIRRFVHKEKISLLFIIFILTEALIINIIYFNGFDVLYYVFD